MAVKAIPFLCFFSLFFFFNKLEGCRLSLERVFKALVSLGLSQTDARVYIFLALKGPEKAASIVKKLKISKQQIYRSLLYLQDNGVIVANDERKSSFSALPFEEALKYAIELCKFPQSTMNSDRLSTYLTYSMELTGFMYTKSF